MRFDDRLETTLRQADDNDLGVIAKWQQLVDILSQNPSEFDTEFVATGLLKARQLMPMVPAATRANCVKALHGRIRSAPLVLLLSGDVPAVAAVTIAGAKLDDQQWADIVPHLPTRARGFLRNRNDVGPLTRRALWIWSSADFVLPMPIATDVKINQTPDSGVQIRSRCIIRRFKHQSERGEAGVECAWLVMIAGVVGIVVGIVGRRAINPMARGLF